MSEQWLSIVEYARKYNVSDMTVRRRIRTGKLQAVLREGKYYIPLADRESTAPQARPVMSQPIVKPHPAPQPHLSEPKYEKPRFVPHHISNHVTGNVAATGSMVDGNTLLAFCEGALKKFADAEVRLEQQYQQKIGQLEAQLQAKQIEINQYAQQIEDLQVLVKILERKAGKA